MFATIKYVRFFSNYTDITRNRYNALQISTLYQIVNFTLLKSLKRFTPIRKIR